MAIIYINKEYLERKTNKREKELINLLNKIGYPTEIEENKYVVEVTPNRPDMLGWQGVIRTIKQYDGGKIEEYKFKKTIGKIFKERVVGREYIAVSAVKNIIDKEYLIENIIELQEKLDQTIGRGRKKVAIGLHDLNKIKFPLFYKEVEEESFIPLNENKEMNLEEILKNTWQGKKYGYILKEKKYPVLYDDKGVISFPPIINSDRTKIDEDTTSFLIDITGTHKNSVEKVMNILLCELRDRGGDLYNIEGNGLELLREESVKYEKEKIERLLGFELREERKLLGKMGLREEKGKIIIPPYRIDFMDFTDIAEDMAIAYGYENIEENEFSYYQDGKINQEKNLIRKIFVGMGFKEIYSFFLVGEKEMEKIKGKQVLKLENALSEDFNTIRSSLKLGLIKVIQENKKEGLPLKFFEIGRVYEEKEEERIGFVISDKSVDINNGLKIIYRLYNEINEELEIKEKEDDFYIKGRCFEFKGKNMKGTIGEVKPSINEKFNIDLPMLIAEITLSP